jgi:hypothetical protein
MVSGLGADAEAAGLARIAKSSANAVALLESPGKVDDHRDDGKSY